MNKLDQEETEFQLLNWLTHGVRILCHTSAHSSICFQHAVSRGNRGVDGFY